jgi:hypothetical protein
LPKPSIGARPGCAFFLLANNSQLLATAGTGVWAELMAANMWPIHVVLAGYWPNMSEVVVDQYSASIRSIGRILAGYWMKYWANIGKSLFLKGARVRPRPQLDHFAFDIARPSRARSN